MTTGKLITPGATLAILLVLWGCSSDKESGGGSRSLDDDRREIAATVAETAIRWHYGDKTILYEQEFEYAQVEHTYDSYLQLPRIKKMEADTVHAFVVKDVKFFNRDSALVSVDVVFVGPTMDTTHLPQQWTMYYHRGRWIRPSMSGPNTQREFEERRRKADSAAAAEEKEEW
jgi:hypothetical protein